MRIAYFVDRFPLISETFVLAQITGMIDRGHDVRVYARRRAGAGVEHAAVSAYDLGGRTEFLPAVPKTFPGRIIPALKAIARAGKAGYLRHALRALNVFRHGREALSLRLLLESAPYFGSPAFDILHCQFGQLGVAIARLKACGVLSGALVTSFRGTDAMKVATKYPAMFAGLFAVGERFLCVSEAVRQRLVELGCPEARIGILRSGIDLGRFRYRGRPDIHNPVRVVSVGRLAPNKGIEYGLEAVRLVHEEGRDVVYRVLGDGPLRSVLEDKARELGIADIVQFEGAVTSDRVAEALAEADVLVTPSVTGPHGEQEGLPNAPKEAMAIGVPVIATNTGGIPELISHGRTGFLAEERNARAIADCILALVDGYPALEEIVRAARQRIERDFEIGSLNDELQDIYRALVTAT